MNEVYSSSPNLLFLSMRFIHEHPIFINNGWSSSTIHSHFLYIYIYKCYMSNQETKKTPCLVFSVAGNFGRFFDFVKNLWFLGFFFKYFLKYKWISGFRFYENLGNLIFRIFKYIFITIITISQVFWVLENVLKKKLAISH